MATRGAGVFVDSAEPTAAGTSRSDRPRRKLTCLIGALSTVASIECAVVIVSRSPALLELGFGRRNRASSFFCVLDRFKFSASNRGRHRDRDHPLTGDTASRTLNVRWIRHLLQIRKTAAALLTLTGFGTILVDRHCSILRRTPMKIDRINGRF